MQERRERTRRQTESVTQSKAIRTAKEEGKSDKDLPSVTNNDQRDEKSSA